MYDDVINFDPNDWESIKDTIKKVNEVGCIQFGTTESGEDITFDVSDNGINDVLKTEVLQKNGWIRTCYYDPSDCSVEESYRK